MHLRHKAALWYAQRGWQVLPVWPLRDGRCACGNENCEDAGKHPVEKLTPNGFKQATGNLKRISEWWSVVPDANVATSSWLRIDVDTKENGKEGWRGLIDKYGQVDTVHCLTPSGGDHYYFKPLGEVGRNNLTGDLPSGIDVRGEGSGYTLLPPSNHPKGTYEWELSSRPDMVEIANPPNWLVELLVKENEIEDVSFSNMLKKPRLEQWDLSSVIEAAILGDRSRIDQAIITALVFAGATDDEIRAVFHHYDTTGKYAEKGRSRDKYLAHSIGKARAYAAQHMPVQAAQNGASHTNGNYASVVQQFRKRRATA